MFAPCLQAFVDSSAAGHPRGTLGYEGGLLGPLLQPVMAVCSLFPSALGSARTIDLAKIFKADLFNIVYFGFLPLLIAFYCLGSNKCPRAARSLMLAGLILPLTPLGGLLYQRVSLLFIVGGVWAFAEFWDHVDAASARSIGTKCLVAFGAITVVWILGSVVLVTHHSQVLNLLKDRAAGNLSAAHFGMFRDWMYDRVERLVDESSIWSARQIAPCVLPDCRWCYCDSDAVCRNMSRRIHFALSWRRRSASLVMSGSRSLRGPGPVFCQECRSCDTKEARGQRTRLSGNRRS